MKEVLIENNSREKMGEVMLSTQPRNGEWIEFSQSVYSIHRIIHAEDGIKLMVIGVR